MRKNILANYGGTAVVVVAPLLALPFYIRVLGPAGWGMLSFAFTLVALIGLVEVGLGQRLTRDIAICNQESRVRASSLLKGLERVYWVAAFLLALMLAASGPAIATKWITGDSRVAIEMTWFASSLLLTQLPSSVYRSALLAVDGHVELNVIASVIATAKHLGGVILLTVVPTIEALCLWHFACSALETLVRRHYAWHRVQNRMTDIDWPLVRGVVKQGMCLSGAVVLAVFALQLDRLMLSALVPIDHFGHYTIAYSLATGVLQVMSPLLIALAPTFALQSQQPGTLDRMTMALASKTLALVIVGACLYVWQANALLAYWLGSRALGSEIKPILDVLMIGSALNLFYQIGYQRWVALGHSKAIAAINLVGLLCTVTLTPFLVPIYGPVGAASGWLAINLLGAVFGFGFATQMPRAARISSAQ